MGKGDDSVEETPEQKERAKIAMDKWGDYQSIFVPAENKFMDKVRRMGDEKQFQQASNQAATSVNSAFQSAINQDTNKSFAGGINPNSGKFMARQSALHDAKTNAHIDTASRVNASQNERYVGGLKAISAIGAGKEADSIAGMSDIASNSAAYAQNSAINKAHNSQLVGETVGAAAGAGLAHMTNPNASGASKAIQGGNAGGASKGILGSNADNYNPDIMNTWNGGQ
ncbi:hypothetical protein [Catenovulum sediminis]|uniref:Uncharacterized protein n=1 Tax=Catenovulum sediminis TaxID=1740262 RepID=A0ABV1RHB6_9ALTE